MNVTLERTVRFFINPRPDRSPLASSGFAGNPGPDGLARYYEIDAACSGTPDPTTGYLVNIKTVDQAVRSTAVPMLERAATESPTADPAELLEPLARAVAQALPVRLERLTWRLGPFHAWSIEMSDPTKVILRQRFDFAAAHRLHVPSLSDDENRERFGKCNNPSGHGHNYQVEPAVAVDPASAFTQADLTRLTEACVIDAFDHTHLNVDTTEFKQDAGGVNPSVENIAKVCFVRLEPAVRERGGELRTITVWETDRTSCTYPAR
ncbi:MAG: 6-carboxytetrahydropterin synthase [Planctomycetota bacterium]